ncbi:hypothetical protein [Kitasatospora purpeofusca]|uniref:hypothetical protein n=1 Tax=Kitasatospora purpeofusca TaxID=67352 RepID=UPI00386D2B1C|nr:hypothetical protein OIP63_25560 [Kitasatospora purpeofusca]
MMNTDDLFREFSESEVSLAFTRRPDPIPGDLRLGWRISALALVLDKCRGRTANVEQIHLLIWALRSSNSRQLLKRWLAGEKSPDEFVVRYDPALSRTIAIAISSGIVQRGANHAISLTASGEALARSIWAEDQVLLKEKELLASVPGKITQKAIRELMAWS